MIQKNMTSMMRLAPQWWVALVFGLLIYVLRRWMERRRSLIIDRAHTSNIKPTPPQDNDSTGALYSQITPLDPFDLENEEPVKLRPFKDQYHLTMAIETATLSDLLAFDHTYKSRIELRRDLISTQGEQVTSFTSNPAATEETDAAVRELYSWLITTYLPKRHPTLFTSTSTGLRNTVTNETLPMLSDLSSGHDGALEALRLLGSNIDTDFLLLLPTDPSQSAAPFTTPSSPTPTYSLRAFCTCFPSGFSTLQKLDLPLSAIHAPVPSYAPKLERSMDKFFATLPFGKIVKRANWSITTHSRLFCLSGNHIHEKEEGGDRGVEEEEEWDVRDTMLRCERQTLHRLRRTGALVFAFKTYLYSVEELRAEGSGEQLARAIDGLGRGNVPGMMVYKRAVVWGDRVKRFLRGEEEEDVNT